jgi:hypothetical protein
MFVTVLVGRKEVRVLEMVYSAHYGGGDTTVPMNLVALFCILIFPASEIWPSSAIAQLLLTLPTTVHLPKHMAHMFYELFNVPT